MFPCFHSLAGAAKGLNASQLCSALDQWRQLGNGVRFGVSVESGFLTCGDVLQKALPVNQSHSSGCTSLAHHGTPYWGAIFVGLTREYKVVQR